MKRPTILSVLMRSTSLMVPAGLILSPAAAVAQDAVREFNIPAQSLSTALRAYAAVAREPVIYSEDIVANLQSRGVKGRYTETEALRILLESTPLVFQKTPKGSFMIRRADQALNDPNAQAGIPEILVIGSKSQNIDIVRTEDATQPYVVLGGEEIQASQATTVGEFLKTRLPQSATRGDRHQIGGGPDTRSSIDLRGLGANQTLILLDGRRLPGAANGKFLSQPDVNAIPVEAIERIEILPSTSGGIYGGSATGGVVNIILKRDYDGGSVRVTYGDSFAGGGGHRRIDGNLGFSLEGGKTRVMISGSHSDASPLYQGDRDFNERARALFVANRPGYFLENYIVPIGGTANLLGLDPDTFELADLVLDDRFGGASIGSPITNLPLGYQGVESDNGAGLAANAGSFNYSQPNDTAGLRRNLLPVPTVTSGAINIRREFGPSVELYVDGFYSRNEGSAKGRGGPLSGVLLEPDAPTNPFRQYLYVVAPFPNLETTDVYRFDQSRLQAGAIVRPFADWTASLDYSWNTTRSTRRSNFSALTYDGEVALAMGELDILQEGNTFPIDFTGYLNTKDYPRESRTSLDLATARMGGSLFRLPGGPANLSLLAEHRTDRIKSSRYLVQGFFGFPDTVEYTVPLKQTGFAGAAELLLPLISPTNDVAGINLLELQGAVRYDHYRTVGASPSTIVLADMSDPDPSYDTESVEQEATSYTIAARYKPVSDVMFRASYGTGFLPPSIDQIGTSSFTSTFPQAADPQRGGINGPYVGTEVPVTVIQGGNFRLQPERSKSLSFGIVLTPSFIPGLRFSADYTRITKSGEISNLGMEYLLANEDVFGDRITRGPLTPADEVRGFTAGPVTDVDLTLINISGSKTEAVDFQLDYAFKASNSVDVRVYAIATHQPTFERQVRPDLENFDTVGFIDGPLDWRGNWGVDVSVGKFEFNWNTQYYSSYRITYGEPGSASLFDTDIVLNQGTDTIPRQLYHDLNVTFRGGESAAMGGVLSGIELSFGIQNLFDSKPPILAGFEGVGYSEYGDPRLRRFNMSVRKSF